MQLWLKMLDSFFFFFFFLLLWRVHQIPPPVGTSPSQQVCEGPQSALTYCRTPFLQLPPKCPLSSESSKSRPHHNPPPVLQAWDLCRNWTQWTQEDDHAVVSLWNERSVVCTMDHPDPRAEPFPPFGCHLKDLGSSSAQNPSPRACRELSWTWLQFSWVIRKTPAMFRKMPSAHLPSNASHFAYKRCYEIGKSHQFWTPNKDNTVPTVTAWRLLFLQEKLLTCLSLCAETVIYIALCYVIK